MQLSELFLRWGLSDMSAWNSPGALGRGHQGFAGLEKIPASKFGTQLLLYLNSKLSEYNVQQFQEGLGESLSKHPPAVFLVISILPQEH